METGGETKEHCGKTRKDLATVRACSPVIPQRPREGWGAGLSNSVRKKHMEKKSSFSVKNLVVLRNINPFWS